MVASDCRKAKLWYAGVVLLAAAAFPGFASSQDRDDARDSRELEFIDAIRQEEIENGPYSVALIEHFNAPSLFYEEAGDLGLAAATIERALQVMRANYGLNSLEQAEAIRWLISFEEMQGNARAAWDLEQELLIYAGQNSDDPRAAQIYRDTADRRMTLLRNYDNGEFPPEIVFGCYYDDRGSYREAARRGSRPIQSAPGHTPGSRCRSGSRRQARRAILEEAQGFYSNAIDVFRQGEQYAGNEIGEVISMLVEDSYRYYTPGVGRRSLSFLATYEGEFSDDSNARIDALVDLADWELLYASEYGTIMRESAYESYRQAYDLMQEYGFDQDTIDSFFSPEIPALLPTFVHNPFDPAETSGTEEYIDVAFVITAEGRGEEVEILDSSADLDRSTQRDFLRWMKRSRFRPLVSGGELADSRPVTARYFFRN